jgi:hypothetical protein
VQEKYGIVFAFLGDLPEAERPPIMTVDEWGTPEWRAQTDQLRRELLLRALDRERPRPDRTTSTCTRRTASQGEREDEPG